jgi:hypothetical protein
MKIIFVCIENFQEYLIDNIKNLQLFGNKDITVITNKKFFHLFGDFATGIELYDIADLEDYGFFKNNRLDMTFRNGFWAYCSLRLFYLYAYIKKFNIQDCIHLENDVMAYVNFDDLKHQFIHNKVYATFDAPNRVIPGIIYIPNYNAFTPIIENYNFTLNDMENLARFDENVIEPLPIITKSFLYWNKISKNFMDRIFDAAAIGQYLGGIDKRNHQGGDTRGFVNETCVVKFDNYKFYWVKKNELYVPHIFIDGKYIPIVNLHIHGKELFKFMSDNPIETKLITI